MDSFQGGGNAAVLVTTALLLAFAGCSSGASYTVGDNQGWNAGVNYQSWAAKHNFTIGDSLVFTYSAMHSVMEVSQSDYASCNTNPITQYTSGSDTITLKKSAQYFICGTAGHCSGGMALQITAAAATATSPSPSPVPAAAPPAAVISPTSPARAPAPSSASPAPSSTSPAPSSTSPAPSSTSPAPSSTNESPALSPPAPDKPATPSGTPTPSGAASSTLGACGGLLIPMLLVVTRLF